MSGVATCQNPPPAIQLDPARIPALLTGLPRWVTWRAGPMKPTGKFDKVPINAQTGHSVSANDPVNWVDFATACAAYDAGRCSGIGIALSPEPVLLADGEPLYLVAVDLDHCTDKMAAVKALHKTLGKPYTEVSPSGVGIRMLALSRVPISGGNDGKGQELYGSGRFVTVTGMSGRGCLVDATSALLTLQAEWFPGKPQKMPSPLTLSLMGTARPETPENVQRAKDQLAHVSADCSYEQWRNLVWSVLSTGWSSAETLAREWSLKAIDRYDEKGFDQLVGSFDPTRGISLGTLEHHAREGGWQPVTVVPSETLNQHLPASPTRSQRLLTGEGLKALPPMTWRVRGLLPTQGLASIYGPSGSAKTFLALDLACAIASGIPQWFGAKVTAAPVAYLALEGSGGIRQRVTAWEKHHGQPTPATVRFLLGDFTLLDAADVENLAMEITMSLGTGAVIVVDTLSQSAAGADENASADMGRLLVNAKSMASAVKGVVILVHHSGKDASRGMRGHSSLFAAMDMVIEVANTLNGRTWRVAKSKDGVSGVAHGFELAPYIVYQDEDGLDVTSCAIRRTLPKTGSGVKPITGRNQKAAYQVLTRLSAQHPEGIPMPVALRAVGEVMPCEDRRRMTRAAEAIKGLTESGHLHEIEGVVVLHES